MRDFDDLVIGAGMGGLTTAALLAARGRRVLVLEAHDVPGGYAHTFTVGKYRFCAQVHYVFGCGEGEPVERAPPPHGSRRRTSASSGSTPRASTTSSSAAIAIASRTASRNFATV